jgi:hypothetical protein
VAVARMDQQGACILPLVTIITPLSMHNSKDRMCMACGALCMRCSVDRAFVYIAFARIAVCCSGHSNVLCRA